MRYSTFDWVALDGNVLKSQRNVRARRISIPSDLASKYTWLMTRKLEGTYGHDPLLGVWPINYYRTAKSIGEIGETDINSSGVSLSTDYRWPELAQLENLGHKRRIHHYFRLFRKGETIQIANHKPYIRSISDLRGYTRKQLQKLRDEAFDGPEIRLALEITEAWRSPDKFEIPMPGAHGEIIGSHAVPISYFDRGADRFVFENHWEHWIQKGNFEGVIPWETIDHFGISLWVIYGRGYVPPTPDTNDRIILRWQCAVPNDRFIVYGFEIIERGESIGWAFCRVREKFLDVDELYVLPAFRRQGNAKALTREIRILASKLGLKIRSWIDYADAEPLNRVALESACELLGLELHRSSTSFAAMVALAEPSKELAEVEFPTKPAALLGPAKRLVRSTAAYASRLLSRDPKQTPSFACSAETTVYFATSRLRNEQNEYTATFSRLLNYGSQVYIWNDSRKALETRATTSSALPVTPHDLKQIIDHETVLYIHGFYNTHAECLKRAAQLSRDLRRTVIPYSWPSLGKVKGYAKDGETIDRCESHLLEILGLGIRRVLAHSMGAKLLLRTLAKQEASNVDLLDVVLVAADVDQDEALDLVEKSLACSKRIISYCTEYDLALRHSANMSDSPRLGLHPVQQIPGVETITVNNLVVTDWSQHSYFCKNLSVLVDLKETFDGIAMDRHMHLSRHGNGWALNAD